MSENTLSTSCRSSKLDADCQLTTLEMFRVLTKIVMANTLTTLRIPIDTASSMSVKPSSRRAPNRRRSQSIRFTRDMLRSRQERQNRSMVCIWPPY